MLLALCVWQWDLISYGLGQGYGQISILWKAEPVEKFLHSPTYPDSLKAKIRLVEEIRQFAFDSLGLKRNDNYTTLYDQGDSAAQWMLTACEPYAMKAYEWHFPLIGSFSYKGYFSMEKAEKERNYLEQQGYDTDIGEIGGWSTLGWFQDPILSDMLTRKEGSLANLIIHELTHGTLYIKNNVDYNENLASFIGDKGALLFMETKYGKNSPQAIYYTNSKTDTEKFSQFVLKSAMVLDSMYQYFPVAMSTKEKESKKEAMYQHIFAAFDTVQFKNTKRYDKFFERIEKPNNTFFMDFIRYRKQQNIFEEEFDNKFHGDFKKYWAYLKKKYSSL